MNDRLQPEDSVWVSTSTDRREVGRSRGISRPLPRTGEGESVFSRLWWRGRICRQMGANVGQHVLTFQPHAFLMLGDNVYIDQPESQMDSGILLLPSAIATGVEANGCRARPSIRSGTITTSGPTIVCPDQRSTSPPGNRKSGRRSKIIGSTRLTAGDPISRAAGYDFHNGRSSFHDAGWSLLP